MSDPIPASALNASRAALAAALADNDAAIPPSETPASDEAGGTNEDKEEEQMQEVNMEAQAQEIRTVFNDPERFNVKVCLLQHARLLFSGSQRT